MDLLLVGGGGREHALLKALLKSPKVNKVYDVSAVSIPANPNTDISARDYFDGVIEAEKAERLERAQKVERIKSLLRGENDGN